MTSYNVTFALYLVFLIIVTVTTYFLKLNNDLIIGAIGAVGMVISRYLNVSITAASQNPKE